MYRKKESQVKDLDDLLRETFQILKLHSAAPEHIRAQLLENAKKIQSRKRWGNNIIHILRVNTLLKDPR